MVSLCLHIAPDLSLSRHLTLSSSVTMRAKRSKKYRKIMSAYQLTFSFREPYQVLLDAAFLKTCHAFHMPLQKYLENTLHGECRLFVTKCTLAKIMGDFEKEKQRGEKKGGAGADGKGVPRRGPGRPEFLPPPTEVPLRHCKHKNDAGEEVGVVSEARCLLDLLAGQPHGNELAKNKQHYILATADVDERERRTKGFLDVRERARMVPGVPIVYVKRSVMILEEFSGTSEGVRRREEKEKFSEGLVGARKRKRGDGDAESDDDSTVEENRGPRIRGLKRAKGPNPLSVMKKKVKRPQGKSEEGTAATTQESETRQTRRGKRGRKKSSADGGGNRNDKQGHETSAAAVQVAAEG